MAGSSTPSPYRDWLRVLAHKATNDRNKLLTTLLNRLNYILFNNVKGLFCVTQVECSSNNVIRLLRNFPTSLGVVSVRLQLHGAICRPDSFVLMLRYCANLKAIRYESTSLNRIVADKSHRVIVA